MTNQPPPNYLERLWLWRSRQRFHHGFALKRQGDCIIIVRFLWGNYWLFALHIDGSAGTIPVSTADGISEFRPEYTNCYRAVADAHDQLQNMVWIPEEIEQAGYTIFHPCNAPKPTPPEEHSSEIDGLAERAEEEAR